MKYISPLAVLSAFVALGLVRASAQTSTISSVAVTTGVVTVTPRVGPSLTPASPGYVGNNLAGIAYVGGNAPFTGDGPVFSPTSVALFTLSAATYSSSVATPATAFMGYGTLIGPPTQVDTYSDVAAALYSYLSPGTAGTYSGSYSGLTYIGTDNLSLPTSGCFYMIHHRASADYFAVIVPGTSGTSTVYDLKPMSWAGGTAATATSAGTTGYFALNYVTGVAATGYAANSMFYLRTDTFGHTQFGQMIPALTSGSQDTLDLTTAIGSFGVGGYATLAFASTTGQFYYLRQDTGPGGTGNTILGQLNPSTLAGTRIISDIANLGGVFTAATFATTATGPSGVWGINQLYLTGTYVTGAASSNSQSVSFAAIADQNLGVVPVSFAVSPSASSGLPIALAVAPSSTGTATIAGPVAGVFTITPTGAGVVTLKASQAGSSAFAANFLQQSFNVNLAGALPSITSPSSAAGTVGLPFTYALSASNTPISFSVSGLPAGLNFVAGTSVITGTPALAAIGHTTVTLGATNANGSSLPGSPFTLTITVAAAGSVPVITNSPLTAASTVGAQFSFTITATGATNFTATGLPPGLVVNAASGAITGLPTTAAVSNVVLGASNLSGASLPVTLVVTIAAAASAPIITNNPLTAAGSVGTPFGFTITASGSPASYTATGLPPGLVLNSSTGIISGTPTAVGTSVVQLAARGGNGSGFAALTITIAGPGVAPIITNNPLTAAGTIGTPFGFAITASGLPASYAASPLPAGLSIVALTGVITGTPTAAGTFAVTLGATNGSGTGTAVLTITVAAATVTPVITSPVTAPGTAGTPFVTYFIAATGVPTSYTATGLPAGLTLNPLTGAINGTPTVTGTFVVTITATNAAGTSTSTLTIVIASAAVAPIITSPSTAPATAGTPFVTYLIGATGLPTSYTATGLPPGLTLNPLTGAINGTPTTAGNYVVTLTATNTTGTSTATLTIAVAAAPFSRIVNFSARAQSGSGSQTLTLGFYVLGANKTLLVRGDGPALIPFGVVNTLADPQLTMYAGSSILATNTGWGTGGNAAALAAMAAQVSAFPLANGSADSALTTVVNGGAFTAQVLGASGDTGTAMAEVYDADSNLGARLVNASARMEINLAGGNLNPLIIGFVIAGNTPKTVLIRGIGPGLSGFGVAGVLANPQITLFSGNAQIATNANWAVGNNVAQITATFAQVGAFPLTAGSLDAALSATLQPGSYTVLITGVGNTSGIALLEIYDVQ